ncbi:MAG TPA: zinc-dependent metalloprotease [Acidimicrobiales bacterium]|nr:zinc-dependent metalloprotease [Acidimicrobiales bacterium]
MPGPRGGGDFLEQMLGDLLGLMGSASAGAGRQTEMARTLAYSVATGGEPEANVEPIERIELEELARIAEMHVSELTGSPVSPKGTPVEIVTVGPGSWAWHTLDDWQFLMEAMSPAAGEAGSGAGAGSSELGHDLESFEDSGSPPAADLVARLMSTMGPMMAAMQLGSAVGHLARSALGPYEVPIPRPGSRLLLVPENLKRFAGDWSLPLDEVRLWVCIRELTAHAVLARPHVATRFEEMLTNVVRAGAEDAEGIVQRLGGLDPTDPEGLAGLLGDPETLFGTDPSPARRRAATELETVTAALEGYVEHVLDRASSRLLGGRTALAEAWRRHQHDRQATDRAAELLFGLDLGPAHVERGVEFVRGVLDRAGEEGLAMLWSDAHALPTPAEIEAPGLWLERVRLTSEGGSGSG